MYTLLFYLQYYFIYSIVKKIKFFKGVKTMRFNFEWKNFLLGFGAMALALCLPVISEPFINLTSAIRSKISKMGDSK